MPSGTEYAKLYGQANAAYCQGDLEEAATILREMIAKYPDDPNVILLQGHIHLRLQQYPLARDCYEVVLRVANTPENTDLLDYARRGIDQIRQAQEDREFALAATEGIAYSEGASTPGAYSDEPEFDDRWAEEDGEEADWSNDGLEWDSVLFSGDDVDEPTVGQVAPGRTPLKPSPANRERAQETALHWSDNEPDEESPFPFLDEEDLPDEDEFTGSFADTGESTFVVSSDLRGNPLGGYGNGDPGDRSGFSRGDRSGDSTFVNGSESLLKTRGSQSRENLEDEEGFGFNDEDLEGLSDFADVVSSLSDSALFARSGDLLGEGLSGDLDVSFTGMSAPTSLPSDIRERKDPVLAGASERLLKPTVEVDPGKLAFLVNAPLKRKSLLLAALAGIVPVVTIFTVSSIAWIASPHPPRENAPAKVTGKTPKKPAPKTPAAKSPTPATISPFSQPILMMMFLAGGGTFALTWLAGQLAIGQMKKTLTDLQTQFDSIADGNFNVKATIYSEDELGQLASRFNQMTRVISKTTSEAQRRAADTERAQEDLQRQVIRLLDDVEGASRGDLTVEAEVSADILGAVADAFNLTITKLREIVRQVKKAAKQVNQSSTDSEAFARNQSRDALRMAEELAVTLNSVQMMTESIQRVAENAREAEEVARTSSITALKGGESVERTVAGILQIRDTVSETARKVKRLAEASQEISKIVALISQIASRTNLLALNASIQAARAGEAGRGFAIVADEVRQLADRSAKSLKEIEQIVLQIQSETGSVMTAMEEGIQQVIDVTERSEHAKKSLEDIIQVSNRIDTLVRSITADTVKQRENSKNVAGVMQSVELTAQETSQESQRVAGSLQKLVAISRDLLASVERFRVDVDETR
ncbi:methyl-accepting chemotaxis protein [Pannus brasiliensis CCIBt3594]|uniref:Methyl-accepting chemotaxis protein n=1 Tax=Pannus brasiliensis CCIBt3594 TaxID=1427578 RepID=A0AAW9QN43_9CHRO